MVDGPIGVLGRNVLRLVVPGQSQGHDLVLNQSHQEMESRVQERNHKTLLVKRQHARVRKIVFTKYSKAQYTLSKDYHMLFIFSITLIECIDTDYTEESWATDSTNEGCWSYNENVEYCGEYDDDDFKAMEMCCACKEMMIK